MAVNSKGQVFTVAAVILGSLMLLTFISYQQVVLTDPGTDKKFYFQSALNQQVIGFNDALSENYTVENVRNRLFSFNSFVSTQSAQKNTEYSAFQLALMPERKTALVINYRSVPTDYSFYHGSWDNGTAEPMSYSEISIPEEREKFRFEADELDVSEKFNSSKPTLLGHIEMEAESETWRNYILR